MIRRISFLTPTLALTLLLAACGESNPSAGFSFPYPTADAASDAAAPGGDAAGDAACQPDCLHRECGDNGCGGVCGYCDEDETCWPDGQCRLEGCTTDCAGKACGDDGCGGLCGFCGAGEHCEDNVCVDTPCEPNCDDKDCGPDGCGGSCGICEQDFVCQPGGVCVPVGCEASCVDKECGDDGCGGSCGACGPFGVCNDDGICDCIPQCDGKECGSDGCAGLCGTCEQGWECDQNFDCVETGCQPDCAGPSGPKQCGGDGCGAFCGECAEGVTCTAEGYCLCVPKCQGKICGSDECGGACGECAPEQDCIAGFCKPDPCGIETCAQLTGPSACCEEILYKCSGGGELIAENCAADGQICTWHTYLERYLCLDPDCDPGCDGAECGPDGCGAFCGNCGPGYLCQQGLCAGTGWTSCNDFDGDAACYGALLYVCSGGLSVAVYDCATLDKECVESVNAGVPTAACE